MFSFCRRRFVNLTAWLPPWFGDMPVMQWLWTLNAYQAGHRHCGRREQHTSHTRPGRIELVTHTNIPQVLQSNNFAFGNSEHLTICIPSLRHFPKFEIITLLEYYLDKPPNHIPLIPWNSNHPAGFVVLLKRRSWCSQHFETPWWTTPNGTSWLGPYR